MAAAFLAIGFAAMLALNLPGLMAAGAGPVAGTGVGRKRRRARWSPSCPPPSSKAL